MAERPLVWENGGADDPTAQTPAPAQPVPAPVAAAPAAAMPQQGAVSAQPTTVVQSQPGPPQARPALDPRPYAYLAQKYPQYRAMVDAIADESGISPQRLAWHWWREGGLQTKVPRGKAGEYGPLQILPSTAQSLDPGRVYDPESLEGGLRLGARYIHQMDGLFGQDTPSSVMAYQGGPGSVHAIRSNPSRAEMDHPNTLAYGRAAFPGFQIGGQSVTGSIAADPGAVLQAARTAGPDGVLRVLSQTTKQSGLGISDAWRGLEQSLVGMFIAKGDMNGAQHARDFVLQMSQTGANSNLMEAHKALAAGNTQAAAAYLARAHAFVPDGATGQFGIDGKGNLWGQMVDDHDPSRKLGQPFQVTPQAIEGMLMQTTDPNKYIKMVQEHRTNVTDARYKELHGESFMAAIDNRREIAAAHDEAAMAKQLLANQGKVDVANIHAQARMGQGPMAGRMKDFDKEIGEMYSPEMNQGVPHEQLGDRAEMYRDLRYFGASMPLARSLEQRFFAKQLAIAKGTDGSFQLVDPKTGQPLGGISAQLAQRLAGGKPLNVDPASARPQVGSAPQPPGQTSALPTSVQPTAGASGW